MRIISFLILLLLFVQPLFAYTVVLKSGKRIHGAFVAEDNATLQIKDSGGVILSFKCDLLDLDSMVRTNAQPEAEADLPKRTEHRIEIRTRPRDIDLAAIADQTQKNRKGNARTVTAADLESAPELTILGTADEPKKQEIEPASDRDEQQWRKEAGSLRKEISRLREKRISAEASCQRAEQRLSEKRTRPSREPSSLLQTFQKPTECQRLSEIDSQIQDAQMRLENFEERARRSEIPWQWIE